LIGVEPEIIQSAEANRVRVLVLRKCLAAPSNCSAGLSNTPGLAAVALVVERAVVCPARFLTRPAEVDIAKVYSRCKRDTKRLNTAVEVLVIQSILIVPDPGSWISHFIADKPEAIVCQIRLDLRHCGACVCPSHYGRLRSHSRAGRRK